MKNLFLDTLSEINITYQPKVPAIQRPKITSAEDAYRSFLEVFNPNELNLREEAAVLFLNRGNRIIGLYGSPQEALQEQ
jgi:DNA repair protein RadC